MGRCSLRSRSDFVAKPAQVARVVAVIYIGPANIVARDGEIRHWLPLTSSSGLKQQHLRQFWKMCYKVTMAKVECMQRQ